MNQNHSLETIESNMLAHIRNGFSTWAVITATRESVGPFSCRENQLANSRLETVLDGLGLYYLPLIGQYKGEPQGPSFLVLNIPEQAALALAGLLGQESVLTERGLIFVASSIKSLATQGHIFGEEALWEDCYSVFPSGLVWSVKLG